MAILSTKAREALQKFKTEANKELAADAKARSTPKNTAQRTDKT
jgi:hypothetical protein